MPEARQNSSKLAEMFDRASSFNALVGMAVDVVSLFMALLSSVESAPRAYRLKASNAASPFSTSIGTIPDTPQPVCTPKRGNASSWILGLKGREAPYRPRTCYLMSLIWRTTHCTLQIPPQRIVRPE